MGMIGHYARFGADDLDRARREPGWALDSVYEWQRQASDRVVDTDKAWHGIGYLVERAGGAPVDVVFGGTEFLAEDWGMGSPRLLTADEVSAAARYLADTPFDQLAAHYDPDAMTAAEVYPAMWSGDGEDLDYLRGAYEDLVALVTAAARDGQSVVLWIA